MGQCSQWAVPGAGRPFRQQSLSGPDRCIHRRANAVYQLQILERTGNALRVTNLAEKARRKAPAVTAELEPTCVYPLIQGSDLSQWSVRSRAWLLCPHTAETKIYPLAEADLRQDLPLTYAYLTRFRDLLETRKGFAGWERAIQERYFYALLRVGPYTFSRYKVAWRYIARSFITAVIAPMQDPYLGETLPLPNEKVIYVGTDCREEGLLSLRDSQLRSGALLRHLLHEPHQHFRSCAGQAAYSGL